MTSIKWISSLAAATAVSLVSFPSGAAESAADAPTTTVRVWDLDLTRPQDVQTLYQRVQSAAKEICQAEARNHYQSTRRWPEFGWLESCVTTTVDTTVRNAGEPLLAALHIRTGVAQSD